MKKLLIAIMVLFFISEETRAQFYDDDVYFYVKAGETISNDNTQITIIHFNDKKMFKVCYTSGWIKNELKKNSSYYDNYVKTQQHKYKYCPEYTTSQRITYIEPGGYIQLYNIYIGNYYWSFSKDRSSLINWREKYNSNEIVGKSYYIRVDKSDLMPKVSNHDFLYE